MAENPRLPYTYLMPPLKVISITGDLATDPAFIKWLMARADAASLAGAEQVAALHKELLITWSTPPGFDFKTLLDFAALTALREVRLTGADVWKWELINYGGPDVTIDLRGTGRAMVFPFAGIGNSYNRKTIDLGDGRRIGAAKVTQLITGRKIAKRDMIGKVYQSKDLVFRAMERAFNGTSG